MTLSTDGALVVADLPAHASTALTVGLRAVGDADVDVTIRAVASSEGSPGIGAPESGAADATGVSALVFHVAATAEEPVDTGSPPDTGAPVDTAETETETEPDPETHDSGPGRLDTGAPAKDATGCGCGSTPAGAGGLLGVGLVIGVIAGRRARPGGGSPGRAR